MRAWVLSGVALALGAPALAEDVEYQVEGEAFSGYFAEADAPQGLVVIVHDWDGLDDYERQRADMLAEMGYDAFAVDLFGAESRPETTEARREATRAVMSDPERMRALMLAGLEEARGMSDADQVVVMGYCFGGTVTLATARTGAAEDVAGYATFHGNFPEGPEWPEDTPPILVMHGGIDQNPSIADLAAFVEEAEAAGLTYQAEVYAGADHAFTVFGEDRYQERADELSWNEFGEFLGRRFGGAS